MNKKKIIKLILLIAWMIVIFIMSSFRGEESSNQSGLIVKIITKFIKCDNPVRLAFIVRKIAHYSEYFILGLLLLINVNKSYYSLIIGLIYAITDEIHQYFVPGRVFALKDILIDFSGVLTIFFIYVLIKRKRN